MNTLIEKLKGSWQLFTRSIQVIREHPKLLVFPALTGLLTLGIALFFLLPAAMVVIAPHWIGGQTIRAAANSIGFLQPRNGGNFGFQLRPLGTGILGGLYLVSMFLATFCSVAFSTEIFQALAGNPVSIRHGFEEACRRWKPILFWSLLAGVVGLIIRRLEERLSFLGRLIAGLLGTAWSVASIFAIPILVREPALSNPFVVLRRSALTIKNAWGEMLIGYVGMQGANGLFIWMSLFYAVAACLSGWMLGNWLVLLPAALLWLMALIVYSYLAGVASRVYLCALYLYASEGVVPGPFDAAMMNQAWKIKKPRGQA